MPKRKYRFTGELPPTKLWAKYPNWEYALDEEGDPEQDETTLRPENNSSIITEYTAFTAGEAVQADKTRLPALIHLMDCQPTGVSVFVDVNRAWSLTELGSDKMWECVVQEWLPEKDREPSISFDDSSVFPLEILFRLPHKLGKAPKRFRIEASGVKTELGSV